MGEGGSALDKKKNIHAGHRERMHERVHSYGLESLAEHEALEYLLYFTNARRDTNAIAHELLERFGDFAGVLEAREEELCAVEGVGPASARLLHLLPQVVGYYHRSRTKDRRCMRTTEQLGEYLLARFRGLQREQVLLLGLDKRRRMKASAWLGVGDSVSVTLPVRAAVARAIQLGAERAVRAHNHPDGNAMPSRHDIQATAELDRGLRVVGIELLDHFIVTDTEYVSLRERIELPVWNGAPSILAMRQQTPEEEEGK